MDALLHLLLYLGIIMKVLVETKEVAEEGFEGLFGKT